MPTPPFGNHADNGTTYDPSLNVSAAHRKITYRYSTNDNTIHETTVFVGMSDHNVEDYFDYHREDILGRDVNNFHEFIGYIVH